MKKLKEFALPLLGTAAVVIVVGILLKAVKPLLPAKVAAWLP